MILEVNVLRLATSRSGRFGKHQPTFKAEKSEYLITQASGGKRPRKDFW